VLYEDTVITNKIVRGSPRWRSLRPNCTHR